MFGLLVLGFIYVLFKGLSGAGNSEQSTSSDNLADIPIGQTVSRRLEGETVWISRLSEHQKAGLEQIAPFLVDVDSGCASAGDFCILAATGTRDGIRISFSKATPPQLPAGIAWQGGFVDPASGAMFDLLGRAYRLGSDTDQQRLKVIESAD